jgi:hypothetical protein
MPLCYGHGKLYLSIWSILQLEYRITVTVVPYKTDILVKVWQEIWYHFNSCRVAEWGLEVMSSAFGLYVGKIIRLRPEWPRNPVRFSAGKRCCILQRIQTVPGAHGASYLVSTIVFFTGHTATRAWSSHRLMPKLRICGGMPPRPQMPSRRTQGRL